MESRNFSPSSMRGGASDKGEDAAQLEFLSVQELAHNCTEETKKFLKQSPSNDRYCVELFRRAIIRHDESAWSYLYQQYAPLVLNWVTQHQSAAALLVQDGSGPLVNAAFAKFAQALTPAKISSFVTLAAILKYLKLCVHSVVADELRARQAHQYEETLEVLEHEADGEDLSEQVVSTLSAHDIWQLIIEETHGEDERLLLYLAYVQGMKPGEISSQQPHYFPSVDDVYRMKRNVLERLRRNRRLQALLRR